MSANKQTDTVTALSNSSRDGTGSLVHLGHFFDWVTGSVGHSKIKNTKKLGQCNGKNWVTGSLSTGSLGQWVTLE